MVPEGVFEKYVRWSGTAAPRILQPFARRTLVCGPARVSGRPAVYLTFDDGPYRDATPALIDILATYDARGTFFLRGDRASRDTSTATRLLAEGHTVGNHGWKHRNAWAVSAKDAVADLNRMHLWCEETLGVSPNLARPPFGHLRPATARWARRADVTLCLWNVMPGDFLASATSDGVANFALRHAAPGSIIVLHDGPTLKSVTLPAVARLLDVFSSRGWVCPPLPQ